MVLQFIRILEWYWLSLNAAGFNQKDNIKMPITAHGQLELQQTLQKIINCILLLQIPAIPALR